MHVETTNVVRLRKHSRNYGGWNPEIRHGKRRREAASSTLVTRVVFVTSIERELIEVLRFDFGRKISMTNFAIDFLRPLFSSCTSAVICGSLLPSRDFVEWTPFDESSPNICEALFLKSENELGFESRTGVISGRKSSSDDCAEKTLRSFSPDLLPGLCISPELLDRGDPCTRLSWLLAFPPTSPLRYGDRTRLGGRLSRPPHTNRAVRLFSGIGAASPCMSSSGTGTCD